MEQSHLHPAVLASAAALGVVAGMRSQMPFAFLAWRASQGRFAVDAGPPLEILRAPATRVIATVAAAGELIGDKLPMTPSRLDVAPLAARLVIGGVAGAAVSLNAGSPTMSGAMFGLAGAALGAYCGYHIRHGIVNATGIPDPAVAIVEDLAAIAVGLAATGTAPRS